MGQARHMIRVAMRQDDEIKVRKVNTLSLNIGGEDVAIIARVEQDSFARDLDKRREAPILPHRGVLAESVVKDSDLVLGCHGNAGGGADPGDAGNCLRKNVGYAWVP